MRRTALMLAFVTCLAACAHPAPAPPCPSASTIVAPPPGASAIAVDTSPRETVASIEAAQRSDQPRPTQDPNPPGTTLLASSVFVDPSPPKGWTQCAGFVNTPGDDVAAEFLDNCLGSDRLRVRVFTATDVLEEDVFASGITPSPSWTSAYLGTSSKTVKATHWGSTQGAPSVFRVGTDGRDACFQAAGPGGTTLGSGHAATAVIAGGAKGYEEYRLNCRGESLPDRKIAVYR